MTTMISEVYNAFLKAGAPETEAREAAEALSAENLSTKDGIADSEKKLGDKINDVGKKLDDRINDVEKKLGDRINDLDKKLSREINDVEKRLTGRIGRVEHDVAVLKWMAGVTLAGVLSIVIGVVSIVVKTFFAF